MLVVHTRFASGFLVHVTSERMKISDPSVMRALAHPARLTILDHLSLSETGATATECAEVVGLSPSATSYHLRALARTGLIEEGSSRGDGRERVWQRRFRNYSISADRDASPDDLAAELAMAEAFLAHQNDKVRRFLAVEKDQGEDWYEASTISNTNLLLTAAELTELIAKVDELVRPYQRQERERHTAPEDARIVTFQLRAVPLLDV